MKISEINETISIIANIGVIGSIIFLGLEMQQNTEMMQSQTRNSIVENQLSLLERAIDNNDFAKIAFELRENADAYPEDTVEFFQFRLFAISQLRIWENEFYQYQTGLFEASEFEAREETWRANIIIGSIYKVWETRRDQFAKDFAEYIDRLYAEEIKI